MDARVRLMFWALTTFAVFWHMKRRWQFRWRELPVGVEPADRDAGGAYRVSGVVPMYRTRAPALVQLAALTAVACARAKGRWADRWQAVETGRAPAIADEGAAGVYRAAGALEGATVPTYRRGIPLLVQVAAFVCFACGLCWVPLFASLN